jgi:bacterioferritin-associated ferredoxin
LATVYVCLCLALTDRDVSQAIQQGAGTFRAVAARCGAGTVCGGCRPAIGALLGTMSDGASDDIAPVVQMRGARRRERG